MWKLWRAKKWLWYETTPGIELVSGTRGWQSSMHKPLDHADLSQDTKHKSSCIRAEKGWGSVNYSAMGICYKLNTLKSSVSLNIRTLKLGDLCPGPTGLISLNTLFDDLQGQIDVYWYHDLHPVTPEMNHNPFMA